MPVVMRQKRSRCLSEPAKLTREFDAGLVWRE